MAILSEEQEHCLRVAVLEYCLEVGRGKPVRIYEGLSSLIARSRDEFGMCLRGMTTTNIERRALELYTQQKAEEETP